jgi:hypothetical protein
MIGRLLSAMDRQPLRARRGVVAPLLLLGVVVAAFALALTGPGTSSRRATARDLLLPPGESSVRAATPPPAATQLPLRPRGAQASGGARPPRSTDARGVGLGTWSGRFHPVAGGAGCSRSRGGSRSPTYRTRSGFPGWARSGIRRTCTPTFARYLLAHPAQLSPLLAAHPKAVEIYRVVSVMRAPGANTVQVNYVAEQDSADTGAFVVMLVNLRGRWLVADLGL